MNGPDKDNRTAAETGVCFPGWFRALAEEEKLDFLQLYAILQLNGKSLVPALSDEWRRIILSAMDNGEYSFRLHVAAPLTEKHGAVSYAGHMWITVEGKDGRVHLGIGYYPEERTLRNVVCGRGLLQDDRGCKALDYAMVSAPISGREILAITELARNRFTGQGYCIGACFGAVDCTIFAEEAARIARIEVPRRSRSFWSYWPYRRMEAICRANRNRAAVECVVDGSVWRNQRRTARNLLRRAGAQICAAVRARVWSFTTGSATA